MQASPTDPCPSIVNGKKFSLKFAGKTVCPVAFAHLHAIGRTLLGKLVDQIDNPILPEEPPVLEVNPTLLKNDRIRAFLEKLCNSHFVEPVPGEDENLKQLTIFHDKLAVYEFFMVGSYDGIQGDFDGLVNLNFETPVSQDYFIKIWKNEFPFLLTESDRPQYTECFKFDAEVTKAIVEKNNTLVLSLKSEKQAHLNHAASVASFAKNREARSRAYPTFSSFVVDNMASKMIPKRHKETCISWSQDHLLLHLGGTYYDHDGCAEYFVYPEIITESSNTILSQVYQTLKRTSNQRRLRDVVFIFDNHSTNKNYTVIAFFEYLYRSKILEAGGYFQLVYLVRGHTHNRLDQRNSNVRITYYKERAITTLNEMVQAIRATGRSYTGSLQTDIYDIVGWLHPFLKNQTTNQFAIKKVHQIRIDETGIITKRFNEDDWSVWRGRDARSGSSIEPFSSLLTEMPVTIPNLIRIPQFSEERIQKLIPSFGSEQKVREVLREWTEAPRNPWTPFRPIEAVLNQQEPVIQTPQVIETTKKPTPTPSKKTRRCGGCGEVGHDKRNCDQQGPTQEVEVRSIKRRLSKETNEFEYQTLFSDSPKFFWTSESAFIDPDGVVNDIYRDFEQLHPNKKR